MNLLRSTLRVQPTAATILAVSALMVLLHLPANAGDTWRGISIAPEHRCSPYDKDHYRYSQSVEHTVSDAMGGRVYGPYTGACFTSHRQTDIEHIVARSEAHDSSLCAAFPPGSNSCAVWPVISDHAKAMRFTS